MAEAAKVIRIELRVRGSRGSRDSSSGRLKKAKEKKPKKRETIAGRAEIKGNEIIQNIAGFGAVASATQLISEGLSIAETLSYNSSEKDDLMALDIGKKAISSGLAIGGYVIGGPIGAGVAMAINQFIVEPLSVGGEIAIKRHHDQVRATNRFYMSSIVQKGNKVFDYSSQSYIDEDFNKTQVSRIWKRRYR